jgi:hypothetical protein
VRREHRYVHVFEPLLAMPIGPIHPRDQPMLGPDPRGKGTDNHVHKLTEIMEIAALPAHTYKHTK